MGIIDTVIDKTKELKNEYDQHRRAEKEDRLNLKEELLNEKEKMLKGKEQKLQQIANSLIEREKKILKKEKKPFYVFLACLVSVSFFLSYILQNYEFIKRIEPEIVRTEVANDQPSSNKNSASARRQLESTEHKRSIQKTYTPTQLKSMIQGGNYPKQGAPSTQAKIIDYMTCIAKVESIVASVRPNYPAQTIVNTNLIRIVKVWTNDAAMVLTCSASDKKLAITSSPYL